MEKLKIKIEEILKKLSKRVFWKPVNKWEIDLLITAYREMEGGKNAN